MAPRSRRGRTRPCRRSANTSQAASLVFAQRGPRAVELAVHNEDQMHKESEKSADEISKARKLGRGLLVLTVCAFGLAIYDQSAQTILMAVLMTACSLVNRIDRQAAETRQDLFEALERKS
jgi:Flp pilus assembly protein TadB